MCIRDRSIDPKLEFVELRLGNVCNVKCVTCNPASSSKWVPDYKILSNKLNYITDYSCLPKSTWHDKKEFWDDLFDKTQNVKTFYILFCIKIVSHQYKYKSYPSYHFNHLSSLRIPKHQCLRLLLLN